MVIRIYLFSKMSESECVSLNTSYCNKADLLFLKTYYVCNTKIVTFSSL